MDSRAARAIVRWQYVAPYEIYSFDPAELEAGIETLLNPDYHYFSVRDEAGALAGYFCYGADARVPGGDYRADALDIGAGLRPDLTGHGLGETFIGAAVEFAARRFRPSACRATVAAFNRRALRVCEKVGFRPAGRFTRAADGRSFVVLIRSDV